MCVVHIRSILIVKDNDMKTLIILTGNHSKNFFTLIIIIFKQMEYALDTDSIKSQC